MHNARKEAIEITFYTQCKKAKIELRNIYAMKELETLHSIYMHNARKEAIEMKHFTVYTQCEKRQQTKHFTLYAQCKKGGNRNETLYIIIMHNAKEVKNEKKLNMETFTQ